MQIARKRSSLIFYTSNRKYATHKDNVQLTVIIPSAGTPKLIAVFVRKFNAVELSMYSQTFLFDHLYHTVTCLLQSHTLGPLNQNVVQMNLY